MQALERPVTPASPRRRGRFRPVLKWLGLGIVGLVGVGAIAQAVAATIDRRAFPAPGQLVPIDGGKRRLHLRVMGPSSGHPIVLLEAGMASFSSNWHWVQTMLSDSIRVVAEDRAGLGWSDPAPQPADAYDSARDLHDAL